MQTPRCTLSSALHNMVPTCNRFIKGPNNLWGHIIFLTIILAQDLSIHAALASSSFFCFKFCCLFKSSRSWLQNFGWNTKWHYPSVLDFSNIEFEKSSSTNRIFNLQKSILKQIFAGYTGSKNPVPNILKIQSIKRDFSYLIFQKSSTDG